MGFWLKKNNLFDFQLLDGMNQVKFDNSVRCVIMRSEVPGVFCAGVCSQFSSFVVTAPLAIISFGGFFLKQY